MSNYICKYCDNENYILEKDSNFFNCNDVVCIICSKCRKMIFRIGLADPAFNKNCLSDMGLKEIKLST